MDQGRNLINMLGRGSGPSPPPRSQPQDSLDMNISPGDIQLAQRPSQHPAGHTPVNIEDLFRGIPVSPQSQQNVPPPFPKTQPPTVQYQPTQPPPPAQAGNSPSGTPMSSVTAGSGGSNLPFDNRQNALFSLLGQVGAPAPPAPQQKPPSPQPSHAPKAPSPPSTESQGKMLLEQITYGAKQPEPTTPSQYGTTYNAPPGPPPQHLQQQQHQQQQQQQPQPMVHPTVAPQPPPSPTRKSMFDFVSPFDALNSSNPTTTPSKRKPVPSGPPVPPQGQSSGEESSMSNPKSISLLEATVRSGDRQGEKRKSVENLMDTITRGQPAPQTAPQPPPQPPMEQIGGRGQGLASRTISESKGSVPPAQAKLPRPPSPNVGLLHDTNIPADNHQHREVSPTPLFSSAHPTPQVSTMDSWKSASEAKQKQVPAKEVKQQHQPQHIIFDVSQPQETIQAPPESSLSTPIALVKVEPTFLPGSTIGATSWIAYAMTRGRVRVISRASGDRTLLQLPPSFPASTSVVDMAVFGNRLAGVTSDGGFVIWELPPVITDDVPGRLLLCVIPPPDPEALRSVRWHPKKPDTVAVASESRIYLLNINEAPKRFGSDPVAQSDLMQIGQVIALASPLVAFAFDMAHFAIATISEDSALELWRISNQEPFWTAKIPGESTPSSIDFLENGIVIGRKNGTIFQLLSVMSDVVLATLKFIDTQTKDDKDMFGHVAYDSRIQTLWIANSRRESLIALRVGIQASGDDDGSRISYFEQISEFVGPKPSIHFVILTADSDPLGDEAHAACIASKVPPGPLAMVAFSVHSSGVDQIIIRKEWYDSALLTASGKLPITTNLLSPPVPKTVPVNFGNSQASSSTQRPRSPPYEDPEVDLNHRDEARQPEPKSRNPKGRGGGQKEKEDNGKEKEKPKAPEAAPNNDPNGAPWTKELRKLEESLHTRIGRTIGKELEKQQQRLDDARATDQNQEVARQEKILKLISTELTKNTTRVVEVAVKAEVQSSVLPALEQITRSEIKAAVNGQISKGLAESMKQTLPNEIERLLLRPDVSNHVARTFSSAVTPIIERHVKESITKTLIPAYLQESTAMHQELSREIHGEILNLKKEIITWQSEALRGQEALIRDLDQTVRALQDQIKYLAMNINNNAAQAPPQHLMHRASPVLAAPQQQAIPPHLRGGNTMAPSNFAATATPYTQPGGVNPSWYTTGIPTGHSQLLQQQLPPPPQQAPVQQQPLAPAGNEGHKEDWDESYLAVLGTQDPRQLRELLARSNPDTIMPLSGNGPLSQAVVLTLIHRLSAAVGETSPVEEAFKASLWWLQRAANILNPNDPLISPYVGRVLPNVQGMLNTTKQRLSLLPGGPPLLEASRIISEVQDVVARKST